MTDLEVKRKRIHCPGKRTDFSLNINDFETNFFALETETIPSEILMRIILKHFFSEDEIGIVPFEGNTGRIHRKLTAVLGHYDREIDC